MPQSMTSQMIRLPTGGHVIHLLPIAGASEIWLNTEVAAFDGLVIGCGATLEEARVDAMLVLESALTTLQQADGQKEER